VTIVDGGELVARSLAKHGVTHLFGLGGGHINPTWWAAPRHGIRIIDVRHEAAAAHCAEGWALATGNPGVALVTAGPGLTNALTGIATAFAQRSPILVIAGAATSRGADSGEVETLDQLEVVRPVTKWARRVHHLERIPEYVEHAWRAADTGTPGPAYLEIAIDLIHSTIDDDTVEWPTVVGRSETVTPPTVDLVDRAAAVLREAQRPAIVAGSGVWWAGAGAELRALAERGIPVVTRQAARGTLPDDHPNCFGRDWQNIVFEADVLLVVGKQLDYFFGYGRFSHLRHLVQIDIERSEIGRNRVPVSVGIVADARSALAALAATLPDLDTAAWLAHLREQAADVAAAKLVLARSDAIPIHPMRLCAEVQARLAPQATLVGDASNMLMWTDATFRALRPGCVPSMGNLGTIGHGVCYALAGGLARPRSQAVWMVGDGSFGFNAMELDTAARHGVPIVTVIMNNRGWSAGWVPLGVRHYERMAAGFDGEGFFVERPDDIGPALDAAFASDAPSIVNVMLDPAAEYFPGRRLA
jgi:acetolactate synthase-1/2/3 large subunit